MISWVEFKLIKRFVFVCMLSVLAVVCPAVRPGRALPLWFTGGPGPTRLRWMLKRRPPSSRGCQRVLSHGVERLKAGASSLDVMEGVVHMSGVDPWFNAGRGAALDEDGQASSMQLS